MQRLVKLYGSLIIFVILKLIHLLLQEFLRGTLSVYAAKTKKKLTLSLRNSRCVNCCGRTA